MKPERRGAMKPLTAILATLALLGCNASADIFDVDSGEQDAGDTETEQDTETATETGTTSDGECVAAILSLYDAGCYLACDHLDDGMPTNCWWTDDHDGDEVLGLSEIESACLFWGSSGCEYHLGMMVECWAEAEGCPEGCDGDDPNGVTMWECLDAP